MAHKRRDDTYKISVGLFNDLVDHAKNHLPASCAKADYLADLKSFTEELSEASSSLASYAGYLSATPAPTGSVLAKALAKVTGDLRDVVKTMNDISADQVPGFANSAPFLALKGQAMGYLADPAPGTVATGNMLSTIQVFEDSSVAHLNYRAWSGLDVALDKAGADIAAVSAGLANPALALVALVASAVKSIDDVVTKATVLNTPIAAGDILCSDRVCQLLKGIIQSPTAFLAHAATEGVYPASFGGEVATLGMEWADYDTRVEAYADTIDFSKLLGHCANDIVALEGCGQSFCG